MQIRKLRLSYLLKITQQVRDGGFQEAVFVMPKSRETNEVVHEVLPPTSPNIQTPAARSTSWGLTMDAIWGRGSQSAKKLTGNSIPERRSSQGGTHWRPPVPGLSGLPRMSGGAPHRGPGDNSYWRLRPGFRARAAQPPLTGDISHFGHSQTTPE